MSRKCAFSCFRASTMDLCIVSTRQHLTVCCLNDSSVRRDKGVLFSLDWISYYHVERKLIQTMRVLSVLPPRDGCVGGSLDPVLGMCLFCSFLVGLFCRGLTQ